MNETKHRPWDSLFLSPDKKAAAYEPPDPQDKIDAGLDKYADVIRQDPDYNRVLNFQENLEYIHDWDQREMLGLLIEGVNLHEVTFDYLEHWRNCYQVPPDNDADTP